MAKPKTVQYDKIGGFLAAVQRKINSYDAVLCCGLFASKPKPWLSSVNQKMSEISKEFQKGLAQQDEGFKSFLNKFVQMADSMVRDDNTDDKDDFIAFLRSKLSSVVPAAMIDQVFSLPTTPLISPTGPTSKESLRRVGGAGIGRII